MIVFIKLLLAHLLGDFMLQPTSWVKEKEEKKHKSSRLFYHILIHGLLALLFVAKMDFIVYAIFLAVTHGLIDFLKLYLQRNKTKRIWFIADQFLHVAVLAVIAASYSGVELTRYELTNEFWLFIAAVYLLTFPASIIIRNLISVWAPDSNHTKEDLESAGKYIGILERLFVFGFIVSGHFEAIGFLLAAKSIFRFGDLTQGKDRRLTEYVLIGTLLSFGFAVMTGILYQYAEILLQLNLPE
ncbi:MAG: DUF3307 domain-containing protein [Flavobacterium sp.]|nr:MAG: DUF3307 domain-containing protein [Flavobacterium sp.]